LFESIYLMKRAVAVLAVITAVGGASAAELKLSAPGAPSALVEKLESASLTLGTAKRDEPVTPQDLLSAARADYGRLESVLYGAGHYGGVIQIIVDGREAAEIPPLSQSRQIDRVSIRVLAGPRFIFARAQVTPLAPGTELPDGFKFGAQAKSGLISDAAQAGIDGWRDLGHAKAELDGQKIVANHKDNILSADIRLAPGPRLRFGDLVVRKTGRVRPDRLREIAGLPSGETFSPEEVDEAAKRLRRTGAFRSVSVTEAETPSPEGTLDIEASVVDEKPRRIGFGAEISSLEGLGLSAFWLHRNLLGGAERLRFDASISGIGGDTGGEDYNLSARFDRPATFTPDTGLYLEAHVAEESEPSYRERSAGVGGGLTHIFSDSLTGEAGIAYRYSEVDDDLGSRTLEHVLLPLNLTWDTRDSQLDAHEGYYVDIEATPFAGLDGGSAGARLYGDARAYLGFGKDDRFVLAGRAQIGSVSGASADEVPPGMLFYSGGAGTVRGQPYQSLAVDLGGGREIGGRSFMAFSGELRAPLRDALSLVAFYDVGFVGADSWGTDNGDWHSGAGLGLRYNTGIGPIRLDVATPVSGGSSGNVEIYIGIGQAF